MIDEKVIADREACMKFFKKLATEGTYESAVVIIKNGDEVSALWYADALEAYTMACLGKKALWDVVQGHSNPDTTKLDAPETDWDAGSLQ